MTRPLVARLTTPATRSLTPLDLATGTLRRTSQELERAKMVRQVVDRAKGLLMAQDGLSEQEAFRRIQKASMNTRTPMVKVAEAVLLADEVRRSDWRP